MVCDYPVSLGLFYSAITDFLGFQVNEGEYKVMGLASFGKANSPNAKKVYDLISWDNQNKKIILDMSYFKYHISPTDSFSENLVKLLGEPRNPFLSLLPEDKNFQHYADIAKGAQDAVVDLLCEIFKYAHSITRSNKFLFSGGVASNSAALDKIAKLPFVEEIIVPPSPGDAGCSIGASYYAYLKNQTDLVKELPSPSLYPSVFNSHDQKLLSKKKFRKKFKLLTNDSKKAISMVISLIKNGEIIGTVLNNI